MKKYEELLKEFEKQIELYEEISEAEKAVSSEDVKKILAAQKEIRKADIDSLYKRICEEMLKDLQEEEAPKVEEEELSGVQPVEEAAEKSELIDKIEKMPIIEQKIEEAVKEEKIEKSVEIKKAEKSPFKKAKKGSIYRIGD